MSAMIQGGDIQYVDGRVEFSNASEIQFPFDGSLVIPRAGSNTPANIDRLSHGDFPFAALIHPRLTAGGDRRFASLRTMTGDVYSTAKSVIFLVADNPPLGANLGGSWSWPYVFAIELNGTIDLPELDPIARADDFVMRPLMDVLPPSGSLSGTVIAFDKSGLEIEADAALRTLGMPDIPDAPLATEFTIQLVDILGQPLGTDALIHQILDCDPPLGDLNATRLTYQISLVGEPPELKLQLISLVGTDDPYLQRNLWVGVWPGAGGLMQQLSSSDEVEIDLSAGVAAASSRSRFLRLCIYHPAQVMQTEVGGFLNEDAVFVRGTVGEPANNMSLSTANNKVVVFNDGLSFFTDFENSVGEALANPARHELYLSNWMSNPHLHLRGSLSTYGIGRIDVDTAAVDSVLSRLFARITSVPLTPVDEPPEPLDPPPEPVDPPAPEPPDPNDPKPIFLAFAQPSVEEADVPQVRVPLHLEVLRVASPAVPEASISSGFIRDAGPFGVRLDHEGDSPGARTIIARWKNPFGNVLETRLTLPAAVDLGAVDATAAIQHVFVSNLEKIDSGHFALGIDASFDPPPATLVQRVSMSIMQSEFSATRLPAIAVLVMNLTSSTSEVFLLQTNTASSDVVLGTLPANTTAKDSIAIALLSAADEDRFTENLITGFKQLAYDAQAHRTAELPFAEGELGELLRRAIASGVKVYALYWDQSLANISSDRETDFGEGNNVKIAATINRDVAGNRGFAVLDRTHRPFGSLHQKATVLVDRVVSETKTTAWVGGIDLTLGRWDTEQHSGIDPDRLGGSWWDIHTRIDGLGAIDVMRNFVQRWEGLRFFVGLAPNRLFAPANNEPAILNALNAPITLPDSIDMATIPEPNAMVQITRTICPGSPFADATVGFPQSFVGDSGELGSFAAYKKAIEVARSFIIINEQYFYNTELALLLHQRLSDPDGLAFLILLVPKNLSEQAEIDPIFYKLREKTLQVLMYGGTYSGADDPAEPRCGKITANPTNTDSVVLNKVAVLYARNQDADFNKQPVYVHSKHMIVDDAWMIIGSTNINYRSMTFDTEINASIVGQQLYDGATQVVQEQRIELVRRMLGLPASYAPLLRDPYAMFMLVKSLEEKDVQPGHVLHPNAPYCQRLHADYVKQHTDALGNPIDASGFEFIVSLPLNDPMIDFIGCNVLDTDGRDREALLGPLGSLASSLQPAYARLALSFDTAANNIARAALSTPNAAFVSIEVSGVVLDTESTPIASVPRRVHLVSLVDQGGSVISGPGTGELIVMIQTSVTTTIVAKLVGTDDSELGAISIHIFEPNEDMPGLLAGTGQPGSMRRIDIELSPPT